MARVSLGERLKRARLTPFEARMVLGQVGHALVVAHEAGCVHGALDVEHVWVDDTWDEETLLVAVAGFQPARAPYRTLDAQADVRAFARLASAVLATEAPRSFFAWVVRCLDASSPYRETSEAVAALDAILAHASIGAARTLRGNVERRRQFSWSDLRSFVARPLGRMLRAIQRVDVRFYLVVAAASIAIVTMRLGSEIKTSTRAFPASTPWSVELAFQHRVVPRPASVAAFALTSTSAPVPANDDEADLATCTLHRQSPRPHHPDRFYPGADLFVFDVDEAKAFGAHRCVRGLLSKKLRVAPLSRRELGVLKVSCAYLDDLGCEMRVMELLEQTP